MKYDEGGQNRVPKKTETLYIRALWYYIVDVRAVGTIQCIYTTYNAKCPHMHYIVLERPYILDVVFWGTRFCPRSV